MKRFVVVIEVEIETTEAYDETDAANYIAGVLNLRPEDRLVDVTAYKVKR